MLKKSELIKLAKTLGGANPSVATSYSFGEHNFTYSDLDKTFRSELNELAGTYSLFRENKNQIYNLMETVIDEVLPQKVIDQWGRFAEIKQINQGDQAVFVQRITAASKKRAKKFVTRVGLAGVYEVARLDGRSFTVETEAFGGAIQISLEEYLDGNIQFSDVLDVLMEGLDDAISLEIEKALKANIDQLPTANRYVANGFIETSFDTLLSITDAYGKKATIYCLEEFAAKILPIGGYQSWSDDMKNKYWENGYFPVYKGHNVVILKQSYDDNNATKVIDPRYCWIMPGDAKPVKIALEGQTLMRDIENDDWSREMQCYKKFGVATIFDNNIGVYIDNSLDYNGADPIEIDSI